MLDQDEVKDEFEQELTQAMRRVDPPETLTRFLAAAAEVEADGKLPRAQRRHPWAFAAPARLMGWRLWAGTAVTAMLVSGVFAGEQVRQRRDEQRRVELAQQQFEMAIGITNHALDHTQARLERAGVTLGD